MIFKAKRVRTRLAHGGKKHGQFSTFEAIRCLGRRKRRKKRRPKKRKARDLNFFGDFSGVDADFACWFLVVVFVVELKRLFLFFFGMESIFFKGHPS